MPIAYGLPSREMLDESARGEFVLGGCIVSDEMPTHACKACGHRWRDEDLSRRIRRLRERGEWLD